MQKIIQWLKSVFTQKRRAYIYRVLLAVGALLATYGYITSDELLQITGVLTALFNVLPTANTSVKS